MTINEPDLKIKTIHFFYDICKLLRLIGGGDFWVVEDEFMKKYKLAMKIYEQLLTIMILVVICLEIGGFFTDGLDDKQKFDNMIFILAQSIFFVYIMHIYFNKKAIKELIAKQCVYLPSLFVDKDVELSMVKCVKLYTAVFYVSVNSTLFFYGIGGIVKVINGGVFTTIVVAWPSMEDRSTLADLMRILYYILWYLMMTKVLGCFVLVYSQTICLRHQFQHLQQYFLALADIFEEDLTQAEKELKFEREFKFGIKLHADTIWCAKALQRCLGLIYSGQTAVNLFCLVLLMAQMLNVERTLVNLVVTAFTATSVLLTTGAIMWNAGNMTVEATKLPDAMFYSGWHYCRKEAATKIRSLLIVSISLGQIPVILTAFGIIPMSYSTYVSIVKSSYSMFTVLY